MWRHINFLDVALCIHDQLMQLLLCLLDVFGVVTRDENLVIPPSACPRWSIAIDSLKWRGKVDCCVGDRLDKPDVLAGSAADNMV